MSYDFTLPDKPSEILREALADFAKIENKPGYEVNMSVVHTVVEGRCNVCLAGAVIAARTNANPTSDIHISSRNSGVLQAKLWFVSDVALGADDETDSDRRGQSELGGAWRPNGYGELTWDTSKFVEYEKDRDGWLAYMRGVAAEFEAQGL